jgi:hypothetical protein
LRYVNAATWQDLILGLPEAAMKHFQASFFKNLLTSHDGHQHKCLQTSVEVTGKDADDALILAKKEFERLTHAMRWTDRADSIDLCEKP